MKNKGILIRVGIDSTYGNWNAPVNPQTGDFVYLPIPENNELKVGESFPYNHFISDLKRFSFNNDLHGKTEIKLPKHLLKQNTHLDPDFSFLTYGDNGNYRGKDLKNEYEEGDFIVFYAGLNPITKFSDPLFYAIIGFYMIDKVISAADVIEGDSIINAHTRKLSPNPNDVIVIAKPKSSGRLKNCILFGEYRGNAYRIKTNLLDNWGGITANDGYIQRSAVLPQFKEPQKFLRWFEKQEYELVRRNN